MKYSENIYALFAQRTQNNGKTKHGHPSSLMFHHSYFWRTWNEICYSWTTLIKAVKQIEFWPNITQNFHEAHIKVYQCPQKWIFETEFSIY